MAQKTKQWAAIIMMIALFAMIAFVTNLCSPMASILKDQFGASNFLSQVGNYGNFIAYLVMGIPSGMLIKKYGYKKTALLALIVGIVGIFVQWLSGWDSVQSFAVYLIGAFISGFCMCMLNTVVNPMLNILGGGGKEGNQLIQIGGAFNSAAAVAVYIIMGALLAGVVRPRISNAEPALFIAMGVFAVAFVVLLLTPFSEPDTHEEKAEATESADGKRYSAFSFRHFRLGILAIFLYMGLEVGTPTYMIQYLSSDTEQTVAGKKELVARFSNSEISSEVAAQAFYDLSQAKPDERFEAVMAQDNQDRKDLALKSVADLKQKLESKEITVESLDKTTRGLGQSINLATLIAAVYWLMMFVGRAVGGAIGGKVSSRTMVSTVAAGALILVAIGMFAPSNITTSIPGINWADLSIEWAENVPVGTIAFILVGLCTSVMWGGIFNLAVEGLGKYTSIASGAFMTMVFGCAVMVGLQGWIADLSGSYMVSYWVVMACAAYILFYALVGSRNVNKDIPVE